MRSVWLSLSFLCFAWLCAAYAHAQARSARSSQAKSPTAIKVAGWLSTHDWARADEALQESGPQTIPVLISIIQNEQTPFIVRLRALHGLRHFPTEQNRKFLLSIARDRRRHELTIRAAVISLARAFGSRVKKELKDFVRSPYTDVRAAATRELSRMERMVPGS